MFFTLVFCSRFVFECFVLSFWFHCVDIFYIDGRFCETCRDKFRDLNFIVDTLNINLELLSVDLPYIYICMFKVIVKANVLYIPPSFLEFQIWLIFGRYQLKISEICSCFNQSSGRCFNQSSGRCFNQSSGRCLHFNDKILWRFIEAEGHKKYWAWLFFPVLNYCGRMVQKIVYFHFLFCNLNQEILPV